MSAPSPRETIGPYTLDHELGTGGMATVWLAHDAAGGLVALKRMHAHLTNETSRRRFAREANVRVVHENVVAVRDSGLDAQGAPWIAFEYVEGETLAARLERGPLGVAEVLDLGMQLCRGLGAAHAHGFVHRDLKPSNVLLTPRGVAKVLDFGIAFVPAETSRMTKADAIVGTPWYLAPEQARGGELIDARVDVWALGLLLYECLAGRGPFHRPSAIATVLAIVREEPDPLESHANVPKELSAIVARCLAKASVDRFATMAELEASLGEVEPDTESRVETLGTPLGPDETRVVALLVASGARDVGAMRLAIEGTGGAFHAFFDGRVVGLWGAAISYGDEAARAARAALGAQNDATKIALVLGRISARDGKLGGEALDAAEKLLDASVAGVMLDGPLRRALGDRFRSEDAGGGHRLLRESSDSARPPATSADGSEQTRQRNRAPLVGRDAQMDAIRVALERCLAERTPRCVLLVGPAGIGKSRLLRESQALLRARGVRVISGRAESFGEHAALDLLRDAMNRAVTSYAHANGVAEEEALVRITADADPDGHAAHRIDVIAAWLGLADDENALDETHETPIENALTQPEGSVPGAGPVLALAVHARLWSWNVIHAWSREQPLAILLEDLHWADESSLAFFEDLLAEIDGPALFVVATARPELEVRGRFWNARVERSALEPLSPSAVAELAGAILGRALGEAETARLTSDTGANPLFVEQVALEVAERGGVLDMSLPLPSSVAVTIQARLDRLGSRAREVCRIASVIGRAWSIGLMDAVAGAPMVGELDALLEAQLIVRRSSGRGSTEYRIAHALVSEATYRSVEQRRREQLHRRVATTLVSSSGARPDEIAEHFERGAAPDLAAIYFGRAVLQYRAVEDLTAVVRCGERLARLGGPQEQEVDIGIAYAYSLESAGHRDRAREAIVAVESQCHTPKERLRVAQKKSAFNVDFEGMEQVLARALELREEAIVRDALNFMVRCGFVAGRTERAAAAAVSLLERTAHLADPGIRATAIDASAFRYAFLGEPRDAFEAYTEAARLYLAAAAPLPALTAEANAADCLLRIGRYSEALATLERVLATLAAMGVYWRSDHVALNAAYALIRLDRTDEALRALDLATVTTFQSTLLLRVYRARALLALGRASDVLAAIGDVPAATAAWQRAILGVLRTEALLRLERREEALQMARGAMHARDEIGPLSEDDAEVFLALAHALRANGRDDDAREVLARGRTALLEAAEKMHDAEWSRAFLENVPPHRELLREAGDRPGGA